MNLFGGVLSITGIAYLMFFVFIVAAVGYAFGRVTIKGVSLGTAGVFIVALLMGALSFDTLQETVTMTVDGEKISIAKNALKIVENLGLILFVTSVGFIAGTNFFSNLKKNFTSYAALSLLIIILGGLTTILCVKGFGCDSAMAVGLLSGALTSTPAFSAAKDTVSSLSIEELTAKYGSVFGEGVEVTVEKVEDLVTVGHGIAYLFGVVGVVLFVQLVPKICKANMDEERAKITSVDTGASKKTEGKFSIDEFGIAAFGLAVVLGMLLGGIKIPMGSSTFSLGTTGGCLLASLVVAHFGHIGPVSLTPDTHMLKVFREFGLMAFLIGAGIPGGASFVEYFEPKYFVYGVVMTIVPMVVGFFFAKYVIKLPLFNNLGGITGGMTSTPALGTLISVAKTDNVASAYAAAYPIALISIVLVSQFIIMWF